MHIFVYGTLTDPTQAARVLDEFAYAGAATLEGLHRVDGAYPTLSPGGRVEGRLLETDDVAALDRYEGVDRGLYVRVAVPDTGAGGAGDPDRVAVYVGDPAALDAPADWPGKGAFDERVRGYCRAHAVEIRRA
ncbi:MAG: gamma-glutamylcyclotransferase [Haloarculaceae archaeon]